MSPPPRACDRCLRRSFLLAGLAPAIEKVLGRAPERRARALLALNEHELVCAVADSGEQVDRGQIPRVTEMRARVSSAGCWACCRHDGGYPEQLRDLGREAPACLFARGEDGRFAELDRGGCVTVVGSRRPSAYGRELATRIGRELAASGVVVSGMALGIDSCAHQGALESKGRTVAVLGAGPDAASPATMRRLYGEIVERGLVLSELPPGVTARRWTFPARNRIMAALGAMTVVVEARERSGSLITAGMASNLGREVGAVPGRVGASSSAGTNQLLRDGAQVVRSGQDVLDSLLGPGAEEPWDAGERRGPSLQPELVEVLDLVEGGAANLDSISRRGGLAVSAAAVALARLELLGYVRCDSSGRYDRTSLAP